MCGIVSMPRILPLKMIKNSDLHVVKRSFFFNYLILFHIRLARSFSSLLK